MAEEENKAEDGQESEGGSKKKLIIVIAIVALLAVGISVGVTLFLLGGEEETVAEEVEAEHDASHQDEGCLLASPGQVVALEEVRVCFVPERAVPQRAHGGRGGEG